MKNLMIVLTLILGVSIFSSCSKEECETCTYTFAWYDIDDNMLGDDYVPNEAEVEAMNSVMAANYASGELCDDALTDAKDAFTAAGAVDGVLSGDETEGDCCNPDAEETGTCCDGEAHGIEGHVHKPTNAWTYTMTCVASE